MPTTLAITISDKAFDGLVEAGNRNSTTADAIATELLTHQGNSYADLFRIGVVTSAAFMARFSPSEYAAISAAAQTNANVAALVEKLINEPHITLDDPRLLSALELLVSLKLLLPARVTELRDYVRPVPANPVL